jgi:hypothetical protein
MCPQNYTINFNKQVGIAQLVKWLGCGLDNHRIIIQFSAAARDFFFSKVSIPAPGPIQYPIQWVFGGHFPKGYGHGVKLNTHLQLMLSLSMDTGILALDHMPS